ncbi:hypothetical protein NAD48_004957, partial [Salmonella enterica]|nr:hypothetical protein [Salmonella enterica]
REQLDAVKVLFVDAGQRGGGTFPHGHGAVCPEITVLTESVTGGQYSRQLPE